MKLAAIYNVWDGVELLKGSIDCIKNDVDLIVIVYQTTSNYGEEYDPTSEIHKAIEYLPIDKVRLEIYNPDIKIGGSGNETSKRNIGLEIAKKENCTHFLIMDCDEYYSDFAHAKEQYLLSNNEGSAIKIVTYFKEPTLRFANEDNYFVPFIHKLKPDSNVGIKNRYPFYADPTRRPNCSDVMLVRGEYMHHYSYVRKNITRKVRNSSAKNNLLKSNIAADYEKAKEGSYVGIFNQCLIKVPNFFNINICE